ncbi:hypothetical protein CsatB_002143 [Cannabis sativa]
MEINNKIGVMMMMMSYIVVVALVFNLPSTTTAVSAGRTYSNIIQQLRSNSESDNHARAPIEVHDHNGKMVTVIEPASIAEAILMEMLSSPEKNQCWGKFCAPWSPCQSGCYCVGPVGTGACVGPPK